MVYQALSGRSSQYLALADDYRFTTTIPAADDFDRPTSLRVKFQELAQV